MKTKDQIKKPRSPHTARDRAVSAIIERLVVSEPDRILDAAVMALFTDSVENRDGEWWYKPNDNEPVRLPELTASLEAAIALVHAILPGWGWRVMTCCVSDDAALFPDFNCPVHGARLRRDFDVRRNWFDATDVDLRPPGRIAIALLIAMMRAVQETERR